MKKNLSLSAVFLFLSTIAFAQTADISKADNSTEDSSILHDTVKNKRKRVLDEITVTANQQRKPITAVRSGLKTMDNPQSVQVIGNEVIEQQQAIRLSEVIKNTNGVYVGSARGGAQESFWSRSYDMGANNMFKNGFRFNSGSIPEVSSLEKVEFLKGGSALLYGNVAPGGILNLVTKTPKFTKGGEINMQLGSYDYYKPSIDFYGPLNNSIAYRFTGSYEKSNSFRDYVKNDRIYINPSLLFNLSEKTQITLQGDYLSADWTPDFGTGIIGKEILDLPRNKYYGALWSTGNTKSASASLLFNHDFNKNWKLSFNSSFQSYRRTQKSTAQMSDLDKYTTPGDWKRGLTQTDGAEKIFGDQLSLQGTFNTGSIKHQIFTGVDFENSIAPSYTFGFYATPNGTTAITTESTAINLFNYDYSTQSLNAPYATRATQLASTDTKRFGAYFQDLISITDYIKVLAGVRWSWQESFVTTTKEVTEKIGTGPSAVTVIKTRLEDATAVEGPKTLNRAYSPKGGIVIQPNKDLSLFASYSSSFTPNSATVYDVNSNPIPPSIIDQFEAGIKTEFFNGGLASNVTLYQIVNSNLIQMAQFKADGVTINNDPNMRALSGETKSKGIEVDITAKPFDGFNVNAGYSYNDMRYTRTSGLNGSFIVGDRVARTPQNTANLSFFYKVPSGLLKGISVGAIGNYIGKRIGGWNSQYDSTKPNGIWDREIPLEGYTTIDASVGYEWDQFSLLFKLSNVTNELNYTVHENYSVNPISPRQVMTSLKYKF